MERINPFKKIEKLTEAVKVAVKQKTEAELLSKRRVEQQNQQSLREDREIKKSKEYKLKLQLVNLKFNGIKLQPEYEKMFLGIQQDFTEERERANLQREAEHRREQEKQDRERNRAENQNRSRGPKR